MGNQGFPISLLFNVIIFSQKLFYQTKKNLVTLLQVVSSPAMLAEELMPPRIYYMQYLAVHKSLMHLGNDCVQYPAEFSQTPRHRSSRMMDRRLIVYNCNPRNIAHYVD